jgi:hypothetical protein
VAGTPEKLQRNIKHKISSKAHKLVTADEWTGPKLVLFSFSFSSPQDQSRFVQKVVPFLLFYNLDW